MGRRRVGLVFGVWTLLLLSSMLILAFNVQDVLADDSWVWVRDTVTGAYGEAVVGTGTVLYIARGTKFYRFLPADNTWTEMTDPPNPDAGDAFKTGTALAWDFGDYIYALCGAATADSRRWFYRYSISQNSWQALANTTTEQGEGDAITWVGINNCIYATIGGEQRPTYFMRYDPSTNSWSDTPANPPAGMGDGASLVWTGGNYLYALRGEFLEESLLYDFWRYSLTENTWVAMADIPADPHDGGVGGVGDGGSLLYVGFWLSNHADYIYALSGNQAYPESPSIPDNRTYRYTISMNSWERLADLPFGVGHYVGCRLGYADGHIYAWQGAPSTWTGEGDDLARYRLAWIVDADGPADFHTIQEAVDAASPGDTIRVRAGLYNETITISKDNLILVGEDRETTIIDGKQLGNVVYLSDADTVTISGFTIQNGFYGIWANRPSGYLGGDSIIENNIITNNTQGIAMAYSIRNIIKNNIITNNWEWGIRLYYESSNNVIENNILPNNGGGLNLVSGNRISANNVTNSGLGVRFADLAQGNIIYHNNFINNTHQVQPGFKGNIWDDGYPSGGNYWSDLVGVDERSGPNRDQPGSDGIGDTSYVIDVNNQDRFPLMGPFNTFNAGTWNGVTYSVDVVSNSTVSDFSFNVDQKLISFNVTGLDDTVGFCRVTVPNNLLGGPYAILVNDSLPSNLNEMSNGTHTLLYFTYAHSTKQVNIQGTTVVPEFPSAIALPLLVALAMLTALLVKRRFPRKLKT